MDKDKRRGRRPKYLHVIVLKGVDAKEIHKRYKKNVTESFDKYCTTPKIRQAFFLDVDKVDKNVVMKDHVDYGCLPYHTDLRCLHDHHSFTTPPIGVPIKYIEKKLEITNSNSEIDTGINDYFLTQGVVCSFPCLLAFIKANSHKQEYRNSLPLAYLMYRKMYNKPLKSVAAPDIQTLKEYGGELAIEEYREGFGNDLYILTPNIKRPYMVAVGNWVEKRKCGKL